MVDVQQDLSDNDDVGNIRVAEGRCKNCGKPVGPPDKYCEQCKATYKKAYGGEEETRESKEPGPGRMIPL